MSGWAFAALGIAIVVVLGVLYVGFRMARAARLYFEGEDERSLL